MFILSVPSLYDDDIYVVLGFELGQVEWGIGLYHCM